MVDDDEELPPCIGEAMRDTLDPYRRAARASEAYSEKNTKTPSLNAKVPRLLAVDGKHIAIA